MNCYRIFHQRKALRFRDGKISWVSVWVSGWVIVFSPNDISRLGYEDDART